MQILGLNIEKQPQDYYDESEVYAIYQYILVRKNRQLFWQWDYKNDRRPVFDNLNDAEKYLKESQLPRVRKSYRYLNCLAYYKCDKKHLEG